MQRDYHIVYERTQEMSTKFYISTPNSELLQGFISYLIGYGYRVVDVDDIILNTIGTMPGFLIYRLTKPALVKLDLPNR